MQITLGEVNKVSEMRSSLSLVFLCHLHLVGFTRKAGKKQDKRFSLFSTQKREGVANVTLSGSQAANREARYLHFRKEGETVGNWKIN